MKKIAAFSLLLCLLLVVVTSCAAIKFDISFVVEGSVVDKVSTSGNEVISLPEDPVKEGYVFRGWYWDEGIWQQPFTANSLLDAPLTKNMKVYAYFVENGFTGETGDTITLNFNTMGANSIDTQTLTRGTVPTEPTIPTLEGYYFCGWYYYPDWQTAFDFSQPLTTSTTIYAKWAQVGSTALAVNDFEDMVKVEQNTSFYDIYREETTGRYFIVYKLGTMRNVIVGRVTSQALHNSGGTTLSWEKSYGWEESITQSIENTLSVGVTTSIEAETGVEVYGVSSSITVGLSTTVEASTAVGFSKTRSIMAAAAQGGSQSLDGFERGRYYDMFVVANQNVYQYFVYSADGVYEGTAVTAAEISSGRMVLSSETPMFDYENIPTIDPLERPDFSLVFAEGQGTVTSPFYIDSPQQLFAVTFCPDANYKLGTDIDLSIFKKWTSIGASINASFSGSFDGCGKTIKNLKLSYTGTSFNSTKIYGLFGYVSGEIKNLNLDNIVYSVSSNHDGDGWIYAGALAAYSSGTISNVNATNCALTVHRDKSSNGIIGGCVSGTVQNCEVSSGYIFSNGDGGLILGTARGAYVASNKVSNSQLNYYAALENRSNGGIVGYMESSTISGCNVSGTKFILAGSDGAMHSSNIFSSHHYCKLRPSMGYIIGTSVSSIINADTHIQSSNSIELKSDSSYVGNTSKNESMYWFREFGGKVGTSR